MRRRFGAPLTYLALAVLMHGPAFVDLAHRTRCACRDEPQTDWFLAWTPHALLSGRSPWITDALAVPEHVNLLWNTGMPLPGLLAAPVTLVAGPMASHTLLAVLAFAASATSMWWAAGRWASWRVGRFLAGLLYGFSPYLVAQGSGHLNLELVAVPPLVLVLGDEILVRQRRPPVRLGVLLGLLALGQLLTTEEVLASTAVVGAAGVLVLASQHRRQLSAARVRYALTGLGTAAVVLAGTAAWPLGVQFFGAGRISAPVQDAAPYAADLLGVIVPTVHQLLGTGASLTWAVNDSENGSYLGVPLVAVLVLLAWRYRRVAVVRFAAALGPLVWLLSLGSRLHVAGHRWPLPLPFAVIGSLPVLGNLAAVRLSLYVALLAALLLAVGLDRLHAEGWLDGHRPAAALAALLCGATLLPSGPYSYVDARVPGYFSSGLVNRIPAGAVAFTYPVPRFPASAPMEWQAVARLRYRSLGGYVITRAAGGGGTFAGGSTLWEQVVAPADRHDPLVVPTSTLRRLLAEITALRARAVLVADGPGSPAVTRLVTSMLGRAPDTRAGGVSAWYLPGGSGPGVG